MVRNLQIYMTIALLGVAQCCIFKFGSNPEELSQPDGHFDYSFDGEDWKKGVDAEGQPWTCGTGSLQSPINLLSLDTCTKVPDNSRTTYEKLGKLCSNGSNVEIINNGHTIQVEWQDTAGKPTVSVALPSLNSTTLLTDALQTAAGQQPVRVAAKPFQFHFHTHSEHLVGGRMFPLELHIVSRVMRDVMPACPDKGCFTVIGVLFELADMDASKADNPFLTSLFKEMPLVAGSSVNMTKGRVLDFSALLPSNRSYATYQGSLTTPPCSEGILWHVLLNSVKISFKQWQQFKLAIGDLSCTDDADPSQGHRRLTAATVTTKNTDASSDLRNPVQHYGNSTCTKLGSGANARMVQKPNSRLVRAYVAGPAPSATAGSRLLPPPRA